MLDVECLPQITKIIFFNKAFNFQIIIIQANECIDKPLIDFIQHSKPKIQNLLASRNSHIGNGISNT